MQWKTLCVIALTVLGLQAGPALGQSAYPTKPIMALIPSGPGGGLDHHGRAFTDAMSKEPGQPMVLDFKPGAGGSLAAGVLAGAPADGYPRHPIRRGVDLRKRLTLHCPHP